MQDVNILHLEYGFYDIFYSIVLMFVFFANSNTLQRICEVDFKLLLHETCGRFI